MQRKSPILSRSEALRDDMSLSKLFALTCSYKDRPAAMYMRGNDEITVTYSQYEAQAKKYAAYLMQLTGGGRRKEYAAIALDTCPEWFPVFWGLIMAGYNAVLLDFTLSEEKLIHMMTQAGAGVLVTKGKRTLPADMVVVNLEDLESAPEAPRNFVPKFADKVALCTSGTTATSRIFVYDGTAIANQVLSSELLYRANKRIIADKCRRVLAFLPFHHVFGFMVNLLWCGFIGYTNVFLKDRSPNTILETSRRFDINLMVAVPLLANNLSTALEKKVAKQSPGRRFLYRAMQRISLGAQAVAPSFGLALGQKLLFRSVVSQLLGHNITCIILGGSHTPRESMRTLNALGYYTVSGFGMTETAITSVESSKRLSKRISGSVGRPLSNIAYHVIPDGTQPNRGEMLVRGASLHVGQLVDGRMIPPALNEDGWFNTGDVVRLEQGSRMYVEGRVKDVIINESGENVYPDEIEDTFSAIEEIEQLSVLGVATKGGNDLYQQITMALYIGEDMHNEVFVKRLAGRIAQINSRLPVLKQVQRVLISKEKLPVVNSIKVKRVELRRLILEQGDQFMELKLKTSAMEAVPKMREETPEETMDKELLRIREKVRGIYAKVLEIPEVQVRNDAHFLEDLGGDSLQILSISMQVEEAFEVLIKAEEYGQCATVDGLSHLLYGKLYGGDKKTQGEALPDRKPITRFSESPEFQAFFARQQALLASGGENPYFVCHDSALTDVSNMAGQQVLNFGSYNYVGMSGRPEVAKAAKDAIDKYGTSASGSRLLAGEKTLYQELEGEIAQWKHAEAALVLVGGHSTNVTIVGNFCGPNDLILYDALAHNSIDQGCRLSPATCKPFPHNDAHALESILKMQRSKFEKVLIIIEGAYSMDGDIADVPAFVALKKKYGCFLMVDEAHSACVIGETGGGVDEYFHLEPEDIDIKMGTLSKGLGTCGGYLAGPREIVEYLRYNLPGFVFSVGISPPLAAATLQAIRLLRQDPTIMARMRRNIDVFVTQARARNLNTCLAAETAIIPVMVGRDEDAFLLSNRMREHGVFVPPAVYPAVPKNKARLRFCVISEHKPHQIEKALDLLVRLAAEEGIALPTADPIVKKAQEKAVSYA